MMMRRLSAGIVAVLWFLSLRPAQAVAPTPAELAEAKLWSAARFDGAERFFSFTCGGKPSSELLGGWELKRSARELDPQRVEHTLTYSDPATGVVVRCVGIEYRDLPATEWVLYFKNIFRQDGGNLWPEDTDPNRAGMSQIQYIQGFYAFWDGLLQRHPHLLIDNCAEGARKLDLETIRRSIVLWRSDCQASMNSRQARWRKCATSKLARRVDIHNARDNAQSHRPRRLTIRTRSSPDDQKLGNRFGLSRREALAPSQDDDFIPIFGSADTRLPAARRKGAEFYFER